MVKFLRYPIFIILSLPLLGICTDLDESIESDRKRKPSSATVKQESKKQKVVTTRKSEKEASLETKVDEQSIELIEGKGTKKTGGGAGGHHWGIFYNNVRAGKVYINLIDEKPLGEHASIQIFLNKQSQGKGIGRIAYRRACELSQYDTVYAHMRKGNVASIKAALAAGFVQVLADTSRQVIMQWLRKKKEKP